MTQAVSAEVPAPQGKIVHDRPPMLAIGVMIWLGLRADVLQRALRRLLHHPGQHGRALAAGRAPQLDVVRAGIFTLVLVSSSFTMQYAVYQAEWRRRRSARLWVVATIILGTAFLGNQVYEWLFSTTRWYTNSYGSLFYIMSGLHGLHVFIGLVAMIFLLGRMRGDIGGDPGELSAMQGVSLLLALRRHRLGRALQLPVPPQVGMRGVRAPHRGTLRSQFLLPAGLLAVAALASLAMFFPGTGAGASGHSDAAQVPRSPNVHVTTRSCGTVNVKGVTATVPNAGNPFTSSSTGSASTGTSSPTATAPSPTPTRRSRSSPPGRLLFAQTCSSCHGNDANGVGPDGQATIGPNLQGVGAATVDFWVSTGRMPAADVKAVEAERKPTRLTPAAGAGARRLGQLARPGRARRALPRTWPGPTSRSGRTCSRSTAPPATPSRAPVTRWPSAPTPRRCRTVRSPPSRWSRRSAPARPTCPASRAT